MAGAGVLHEHPVLAVNGNKKLRPGQGQHQFLVFLEAMAGHVDALAFAVDDLGAKHHQLVNRVHHRDGVPGNRAGGENNRVGGLDLHLWVLAAGDAAECRQRFPLAAGHQQQRLAIGDVVDLFDRYKEFVRCPHVTELSSLGDHIEHRAAQQADLAAVLEGQLKDHRNPMNGAGEGGDDDPPFGIGDVAIEIVEHRTLRRTEARHLGIGGITEQTEDTLLAVVSQTGHVEMLSINRGVIKFEITGEDHRSHGCGDGQRVAVSHRVGVANEFH